MSKLHLLEQLPSLGVDGLRQVWRAHLGEPPSVQSGDILRRSLAEKIQEEAYGCDARLDRRLAELRRRHRPGRKPRVEGAKYQQGALLVREWAGVRHEVRVVDGAYVWNGERHASLSKIARLITGVRWNGPRFFGLRPGKSL